MSDDYRVRLSPMFAGTRTVLCSREDGAKLDLGYVLRHGDELVQVVGISGLVGDDLGAPPPAYVVQLDRGYGESPRTEHDDWSSWDIVNACDHDGALIEVPELGEVRCEKCGEMAPTVEKHLS